MHHRSQHLLTSFLLTAALLGQTGGRATWAGQEQELRERAAHSIYWRDARQSGATIPLKILAINDFHSQITSPQEVEGRAVGSAPVLAAYLKEAQARAKGQSLIVHAGDHVGASQPQSSLLQDEPGIMFFNMLGNAHCRTGGQYGADCDLIGIPGNHELDEGADEMLRLINGGLHAQGPFLQQPYQGAAFPYLCANLVREATGEPLFAPSLIRMVDGVPVGFIGAVLQGAGIFLPPEHLAGLRLLDEAEAINRQAQVLRAQGVRTMVVLIHQGGYQDNSADSPSLGGDLAPILARLDGDIDVVIGGHTHTYHNLLVPNAAQRLMLVVQAWPKGTGLADIDLEISRDSGQVVAMNATITTTWADQGPGLHPDPQVTALAQQVDKLGSALAAEVIARATKPITRATNSAGESALGNLVADAQRQVMGTDFAFMHPEGIEADIPSGALTRGDHFTIQPAKLNLIKLEMTGQQIVELLNQQWSGDSDRGRFLQVSGLSYSWDARQPVGQRVVRVEKDGQPLERQAVYTVAVNEYLAGGGDNFTTLTRAANPVVGPFLAEALMAYMQTRPQPLAAGIEGRISRMN